jgi:NADH-quinone oxidoreductase subunit G
MTITIEIDGKKIKVEKNTTIIAAADKAGIPIPRFCYHKKL